MIRGLRLLPAVAAAILALACRAQTSEPAGPAPTASGPSCAISLTDTAFLDVDGLAPAAPKGAPLSCGPGTRGPAETRLMTLTTSAGVALGVGRGGQIYSIRMPGIAGDLIPMRRPDAPFVDGVLQTVATNRAERRGSPRGAAAAAGGNDPGPGWHYHQAGAYQRGVLAGRAPTYSRIVWEHFDPRAGTLETLTLAVQAHPTRVASDRFLAYQRLRALDPETIELTQGWINTSRDDLGEAPTLDHFNFPYLTLNADALTRFAVDGADVTDTRWPNPRGQEVPQGTWIGGFAGAGADAPGLAIVRPAGQGTRLRYGNRPIRALADDGAETRQQIFVVSNGVTNRTLSPGEALVATSYLVFGRRGDVARRAAALAARARVAPATVPPARDLTGLCGGGTLTVCGIDAAPRLALAARFCSACLPVYELHQGARVTFSTEPYLGALGERHLSDPAWQVRRIVGWLLPTDATPPAGYRAVALSADAPIRAAPHDLGRFAYLTKR